MKVRNCNIARYCHLKQEQDTKKKESVNIFQELLGSKAMKKKKKKLYIKKLEDKVAEII